MDILEVDEMTSLENFILSLSDFPERFFDSLQNFGKDAIDAFLWQAEHNTSLVVSIAINFIFILILAIIVIEQGTRKKRRITKWHNRMIKNHLLR